MLRKATVQGATMKALESAFSAFDATNSNNSENDENDDSESIDDHSHHSHSTHTNNKKPTSSVPTAASISSVPSNSAAHTQAAAAAASTAGNLPPPLSVFTERELKTQFGNIKVALQNSDSDFWASRSDALLTLQRLVLGGAYSNYTAAFVAGLKTLPISDQIRDLRSQVTGQCCKTIST